MSPNQGNAAAIASRLQMPTEKRQPNASVIGTASIDGSEPLTAVSTA
jgi:hypothetical protein